MVDMTDDRQEESVECGVRHSLRARASCMKVKKEDHHESGE